MPKVNTQASKALGKPGIGPIKAMIRSATLEPLSEAMQEWLAICARTGTRPTAYTRLPNALLPWLLRLPTPLFSVLAKSMLTMDEQARSSMWDDIQAKKRTEIMFLNGAVVRLGQMYHIPTPVNTLLVEQIKRLESGDTRPLTAKELLSQL